MRLDLCHSAVIDRMSSQYNLKSGFTKIERSSVLKFDLVDLRIFLSAVEGGSLTAAAAKNNIVVAAVSARLKKMEEAFELPLLERTGRGIRTTLAGDLLARHARQVLTSAHLVETELSNFAHGRGGQIRFLSNTNMLAEHMPAVMGRFLTAHPDIGITVSDKPSLEVVPLLRNGDADIGIVAASADMTGLERWRFVPDKLVLVAPLNHSLGSSLDFSRILDQRLIGLQKTVALSQFLRRKAVELGRDVVMRMRMDGFEGVCRMVESGAGVAVVPETAALRYAHFINYAILRIDEDWADRELYVCVRSADALPGHARKFLAHLLAYADEFQQSDT